MRLRLGRSYAQEWGLERRVRLRVCSTTAGQAVRVARVLVVRSLGVPVWP